MKDSRHLTQVHNPLGSRELASVRTSQDVTQLLPREARLGFRPRRAFLVLTALLAVASLYSPCLHAGLGPMFTAGAVTVGAGGSVDMPITVTGFQNVAAFQFSLTWESGLLALQPTPIENLNSALSVGSSFLYNPIAGPGSGMLVWSWINASQSGARVIDGTAIFDVQFIASSTLGLANVTFGDIPTGRLWELAGGTYADGTPGHEFAPFTWNNGSINVTPVPEPVNCALGLFACLFIGSATVRWVSNRRVALRSA